MDRKSSLALLHTGLVLAGQMPNSIGQSTSTMYEAHDRAHVITLHHKCGHKYQANTAGKNGGSNNKVNTGIFLYGRGRRRALGCNKVNQSL